MSTSAMPALTEEQQRKRDLVARALWAADNSTARIEDRNAAYLRERNDYVGKATRLLTSLKTFGVSVSVDD